MAAPVAIAVISKAPAMESPVVLRKIKLPHVINVMMVSNIPARMAQRLDSG
jgi:hypothetical protein